MFRGASGYPEPGSNRHSKKELVFETSASTNSAIRASYVKYTKSCSQPIVKQVFSSLIPGWRATAAVWPLAEIVPRTIYSQSS